MQTKNVVVVSGGLSEESTTHRLADALTKATRESLATREVKVSTERLNIRDLAQEIVAASLTGFASGRLAEAYEALAGADAVIAVSPTYKASYTGLFKGFWDVTPDGAMAGVPTVVGATGGTARHSLMTDTAMRPLFAYMKSPTMPTAVYAAPDDWASQSLQARAREAAEELADALDVVGPDQQQVPVLDRSSSSESSGNVVRSLANTRDAANDPFANVSTMDQMLR